MYIQNEIFKPNELKDEVVIIYNDVCVCAWVFMSCVQYTQESRCEILS